MSASSISRAANDPQLQARVRAIAQKEIVQNTALAETNYGRELRSSPVPNIMPLMWPVATNNEKEYEKALKDGRGAPGHDEDIISDSSILSTVVEFWPADPVMPVLLTAPSPQSQEPEASEEPEESEGS